MCMSKLDNHLSMYNIVFFAWEMSVLVQVLVIYQPPHMCSKSF